jgi:hypothetical protein
MANETEVEMEVKVLELNSPSEWLNSSVLVKAHQEKNGKIEFMNGVFVVERKRGPSIGVPVGNVKAFQFGPVIPEKAVVRKTKTAK